MSAIGFGTWKLPANEASQVIQEAVSEGFTHIDTAAAYANESAVGEGIRSSGVHRRDIFVSGKLWVSRRTYDGAISACKKTIRNLQLDYLDQYLIHWPATAALHEDWPAVNAETWRALEALQKEGLVRRIGVCNFKKHHLAALLPEASVPPMVNQIEFHPGFMQEETITYCKANGMDIEAWSPLGNGKLLDNPVLQAIAVSHDHCSAAQVCLRWCLAHEAFPITKTVSQKRMRENLESVKLELAPEEIARIDKLAPLSFSGLDPDEITNYRL